MAYCFWLKNRLLRYERIYKRIQDIISIIGGVFEFISFVSIVLNYLYSKFIVLWDTEILLFSSFEEYEKKQKESENNNSANNFNSINHLLKVKDNEINFESSKSLTSIRLNINKRRPNNNSLKEQNIAKRNKNKALEAL